MSSSSWSGFLAELRAAAVDYARIRLMDVERESDDRNIPDQADLRYGVLSQPAAGGMTIGGWLVLGAVVIGGGLLFRRLTR